MPSPLRLRATLLLLTALAGCAGAPPAVVAASAPAAAPMAVAIAPEPAKESEEHAAVPVLPDDPTWGSRLAPVTMVMFSDFQCPYCAKLAVTVDALEAAYGRDQLRLVWKNKPLAFHPNAKPAAEAGTGVFALGGSEAFWHFYALAFANQGQLGEASYEAWAAEAGVDPVTLRHGIEDHRWVAKVEADNAMADRLGVSGTPASFINGVLISGALPLEKFKEQIDAELARARDLTREGTAADHVYTARAQANFTGKPIVTKPAKKEDTTTVYRVPVGHSPTRGKATALVTIVEFADFQCPYCARVEATLAQIRTTYGDQVRFVWKDAPISGHPRARPAMELGREARAEQGDAGFWKVHDAIFASSPKLEDADLDAIAAGAGLDAAKVRRAIDQNAYDARVYEDEDLADEVQASGTPHFFINGRRLVGAQPFDKFQKLIDEEIVHASTMVAGGVPASGVYERIIRDGSRGPRFDTASLPLAPHAPSLGSAGAQVVIQELGDFQCPLCAQAEDTVKEVMKRYGTKVRLVWRDDPSQAHADGALAAEAAREAWAQRGAAGFWAMHDLLVKNQPANGVADGFARPALDGYAAQLGLDLGRWGAALDAHTHKATVDAEIQLAQAAGISGAPAFVIGGYLVTGHVTAARYRRVIDEVLAHGPAAPTHHATSGAAGGTTVLPDGLQITDTAVGTGPAARSGDRVSVHYVGTLTNGTVFDSSRTRNSPFEVQLGHGSVIKGWEEGLLGMKVGGKRKLVIPAALGYGSRGAGGTIPPDSVLVFDIELLGIQ